jgi:thioredoxin-like negative regulator of GroEL
MILVVGVTIKLAGSQSNEPSTSPVEYKASSEAGELAEGMVGITKESYDEIVTNSKGFVIVDYYAPTCSYCVKYVPEFAAAFEEYKERAVFAKFDVTTDQGKIAELEIKGTPETIIFKDGKEIGRVGGYVKADALKSAIEKALTQ